jgi:ATP-dependent RNA helicase MSS116
MIKTCRSLSGANLFQILVATPGRLLDHIENKSGLSMHLKGLKMLILDEADHLLDLGFRKDVEKIVDCLPRQRQSLLFSATIPKEVRFFLISLLTGQTSSTIVSHDFILILIMLMQVHRISQLVLKREHDFVNTVGVSCMETPAKVYLKSRNCCCKLPIRE